MSSIWRRGARLYALQRRLPDRSGPETESRRSTEFRQKSGLAVMPNLETIFTEAMAACHEAAQRASCIGRTLLPRSLYVPWFWKGSNEIAFLVPPKFVYQRAQPVMAAQHKLATMHSYASVVPKYLLSSDITIVRQTREPRPPKFFKNLGNRYGFAFWHKRRRLSQEACRITLAETHQIAV